jgi:hypothetical protein
MTSENIGLAAAFSPKQRWFLLGVTLCASGPISMEYSGVPVWLPLVLITLGFSSCAFQWWRNSR